MVCMFHMCRKEPLVNIRLVLNYTSCQWLFFFPKVLTSELFKGSSFIWLVARSHTRTNTRAHTHTHDIHTPGHLRYYQGGGVIQPPLRALPREHWPNIWTPCQFSSKARAFMSNTWWFPTSDPTIPQWSLLPTRTCVQSLLRESWSDPGLVSCWGIESFLFYFGVSYEYIFYGSMFIHVHMCSYYRGAFDFYGCVHVDLAKERFFGTSSSGASSRYRRTRRTARVLVPETLSLRLLSFPMLDRFIQFLVDCNFTRLEVSSFCFIWILFWFVVVISLVRSGLDVRTSAF